jgi:hypothetical protein
MYMLQTSRDSRPIPGIFTRRNTLMFVARGISQAPEFQWRLKLCRTTHRKCVTSFLSTAAERKFLSGQNICFILTVETVSGWAHCQVHSHLNRSESTDRGYGCAANRNQWRFKAVALFAAERGLSSWAPKIIVVFQIAYLRWQFRITRSWGSQICLCTGPRISQQTVLVIAKCQQIKQWRWTFTWLAVVHMWFPDSVQKLFVRYLRARLWTVSKF